MIDPGRASGSGPVCPFVALVEDRDRRADGPDSRNRCYAAPAPRQREVAYQAEYCYSERFSTCAAFLDWAARNAAEPSYPVPGVTAARPTAGLPPELDGLEGAGEVVAAPSDATSGDPAWPMVTPRASIPAETADWVSAAAWARHPTAELEEPATGDADEEEEAADGEATGADEAGTTERDESTTAPRVPAALPLRRRRRPQQPIRTRGSGEWFYSDPPEREPLVRRRFSAVPPVALGVVGLLVVALVVLLVPSLLSGGGRAPAGGGVSPSPGASTRRAATPRPTAALTAEPSQGPATPEPSPRRRSYRVRTGDTLSRIAARFGVPLELLQCQNLIRNPNLITVGQQLTIPPEGYACAPGWRRATPTPELPDDAATAPPVPTTTEDPA